MTPTRTPLAVLGLGGIGGVLAASTGALCVGTERTVDAIRTRGLRVTHGGETIIARPEVTTRLERPVALLVVAVKAYDLGSALDRVAPGMLDDAVVLPLLNGLEHVDAIRLRLSRACNTLLQAPPVVAAGRSAACGHLAGARGRRTGRAGGREDRRGLAGSRP